jgi:UMF1 family MFS transporter
VEFPTYRAAALVRPGPGGIPDGRLEGQDPARALSALAPAPAAPPAHVITFRSVTSWVLYDLANTVFSMGIISLYFPLYVRDEAGAGAADRLYGFTNAVSMGIIFVLSPLLGAITDRVPRRIPFLTVSTIVCVGLTALLGHSLWSSLVFFVIANIAYQAGLQFYDALLPEVSTEENRGWIGGVGVGVGYLGSFLGIGTGLLMLQKLHTSRVALFQVLAAEFLIFALPSFVWVRERGNPQAAPLSLASVREAFGQVIETVRQSNRYPGLFRFLIGRVLYTDAVNTVIAVMGLYVTNVAVRAGYPKERGEALAQIILLVAVVCAVVGGFVWGKVVDRIGPKITLDLVLFLWIAVLLLAAVFGPLRLPLWLFYVIAGGAGIAMGGVTAADRVYMLRLTPPDRIGEFYGLYGMVGRFSAVTGPLLWGIIVGTLFAGRPEIGQPIGIVSMTAMVVVGWWVLRKVSDRRE